MTRAYLTHSLNVDDSVVSDEERAERYEREYEDIPSVADLAKLIGKLRLNCHTLCDDELRPYGIGVYPVAAMMNHSENPNCFATFKRQEDDCPMFARRVAGRRVDDFVRRINESKAREGEIVKVELWV